jgi:hypothetical protein
MRQVARVDANQGDIVNALRHVGAGVVLLHQLGHGVPDLLCGFRGRTVLIECKTEQGRLTDDQYQFLQLWPGEVHVVQSAEEALRVMGVEG